MSKTNSTTALINFCNNNNGGFNKTELSIYVQNNGNPERLGVFIRDIIGESSFPNYLNIEAGARFLEDLLNSEEYRAHTVKASWKSKADYIYNISRTSRYWAMDVSHEGEEVYNGMVSEFKGEVEIVSVTIPLDSSSSF